MMKKKSTKKTNGAREEDPSPAAAEGSTRSRGPTINYEEFTRAWRDAASVSEVAAKFMVRNTSVSAIANRLRKRGVDLARFPRHNAQPIDVKLLNKIAAGKA